MYHLYTDGSSHNGIGSWAFAIVDDCDTLIRDGGEAFEKATNSRGEMLAVINGLKAFKKSSIVEVISDSAFVVNCFKDKWYIKWRNNGWYASSGPVKNVDLWKELLSVAESFEHPIQWTHIRGHQGNKWNEYVDDMCTRLRREKATN